MALLAATWILPPLGVAVSSAVLLGCQIALGLNAVFTIVSLDLHLARTFPPALLGPIGMITAGIGAGIGWLMGRIIEACSDKKAAISTRDAMSAFDYGASVEQTEVNRLFLSFAPKPSTPAPLSKGTQNIKVNENLNSATTVSESEASYRRSAAL